MCGERGNTPREGRRTSPSKLAPVGPITGVVNSPIQDDSVSQVAEPTLSSMLINNHGSITRQAGFSGGSSAILLDSKITCPMDKSLICKATEY